MSRVEELPDDFDDRLNINDAPPEASSASLADMYEKRRDHPEAFSSKSFEEVVYDMSKTPLFMNNTDVANASDDNELLEAIKALQYEGTKAEVLQNFKDQGNEMVKNKRWQDAKEFYTKGIAVLTSKADKWDKQENEDADAASLKLLEEQIYVNRALCNLELRNYRSTNLDCAATLRVNPKNIKAHYRSASALLALDKVHEALDVCHRGLKLDDANTALKALHQRVHARADTLGRIDRKRKEQQTRLRQEKQMLQKVLTERKVKMRGSENPPDLEDAQIRLSPDPMSRSSLLEFPVMLLYPTHHQTDLIKAFAEKDWLSHHLSYILPLPWDGKKEYTMDSIDCYMDTLSGGLMKVGKKLKLLDILSNGKTEIVDGLVRVYVVPKARTGQWIEEVKKQKGR